MNAKQKLDNAILTASLECIDGKHGNGEQRVMRLKHLGFSKEQIKIIQRRINEFMYIEQYKNK